MYVNGTETASGGLSVNQMFLFEILIARALEIQPVRIQRLSSPSLLIGEQLGAIEAKEVAYSIGVREIQHNAPARPAMLSSGSVSDIELYVPMTDLGFAKDAELTQ